MPSKSNPAQVSRMKPDQFHQANSTLAQAFADYPLVSHLFPQPDKRARVLPHWAGYPLQYASRYGLIYTTPGAEGVAVWIDPQNTNMSIPRHIRSGMLTLPLRVGLGTFRRMMAVEAFMEERWAQSAPGRRWYLWIMGVQPGARKRGLGSALVEMGTRQANADGLPCCLETHNQQNVAFYGRFGFETVFAGPLPGHDLPVYMMVRQPRG